MTEDVRPDDEERRRRRRGRSIAIAVGLAVLAVTFYALTMVQFSQQMGAAS